MTTLRWITLLVLASACTATSRLPSPSYVDLPSYVGTWYEIARLPVRFQRDCVASRVDYALLPSGKIGVTHVCRRRDGTERSHKSDADVVDRTTNARLLLRSDAWWASLAPAPKLGNYWILDVAADYRSAIVASPDRSRLWLLARDPDDGTERLPGMIVRAREMGFPVDKLVRDEWPAESAVATTPQE